jgi:DNA-directed RNA polymerase omega subunit
MPLTTSQDAANAIGGSQFELCLIATVRVRELKAGARPLLDPEGSGHSVTALKEIEAGLIGREYLAKVKLPPGMQKG